MAIFVGGNTPNPGSGSGQIVPNANPEYTTIVLGNPDPQNQLLDPDPTKSVAQLVLETFGIPFSAPILGGSLPGYDIRNQDATTILRLSLVTELLDLPPEGSFRVGPAGFAEVELDGDGIARFYMVGASLAENLDIRYCIPTGQMTNAADLVIVRGYDPPVRRELREPFDGLKNKEFFAYDDCAQETCEQGHNSKYATISYDDPALDQSYQDDIQNSYEIGAFESLLGYIVDFDISPAPEAVPGLRVSFGDSTKEYIRFSASLFKNTVVQGNLAINSFNGVTGGSVLGAGRAQGANVGGAAGSSVPATITTVNKSTGECFITNSTIVGSLIVISADRFKRPTKFGLAESDFIGVQDIVFSGQKVMVIFTSPFHINPLIKPQKELISLQHGRNWTWSTDAEENVEINLFSVIDSAFTQQIHNLYNISNTVIAETRFRGIFEATTDAPNSGSQLISEEFRSTYIAGIGDSLGYKAVNGTMCIVLERRRPSIDIFDPRGQAMRVAENIRITYTPIVLVDAPAPIAYASTQPFLQSIDEQSGAGGKTIPGEGIIDQTDGIRDNDPSTTQDFDESELSILQDNTNGSTIDITLPFCTDDECLQIARNFRDLQNETVISTSVVLGPDSQPRLGDVFTDDSGNISIINEINYSYTDASQYLITITTGPRFLSAGSFNDSQYQLQTEDVTKEGIIVQDRGDGATYVVRVQGGDELVALSFVLEDISVGDKCQVRIFNNPVEHI